MKIQSKRYEVSQRLVKHNIVISLHSFLKYVVPVFLSVNGRREVYWKVY